MRKSTKQRWHILFSGRVQHVGFRYTAYYLARDLQLTGWVDNLPDGRVEMEVQGELSQLRRLLLRLKSQNHIRITRAEIDQLPCKALERRFSVCAGETDKEEDP